MIRFEIKGGQTLYVTDMVSGERLLTKPKRVCFYRFKRLYQDQQIQIYDEDQENDINANLVTVSLDQAEDETGTAFVTPTAFEDWASDKLGFSTAPGGSGAVDSVVGGDDINVDNTDPSNPIVNFTGKNDAENPKLLIELGSSQNLNTPLPTQVDFSSVVYNQIVGSSVAPGGSITLPPGNYKVSHKIYMQHGGGPARRQVITSIVIIAPVLQIIFNSTTASYLRNTANADGHNDLPAYDPQELQLVNPATLAVFAARAGDPGGANTLVLNSYLQFEKVDK
jgi:hypothetical protein